MRTFDDDLLNDYRKDQYEITLTYLGYDDGESDRLSFPIKVRERHLTPGPSPATLQGIGPELQITVWSERENIVIRIPVTTWRATTPYSGTLSGPNNGMLSVGRFEDVLSPFQVPDEKGGETIHGYLWTHQWPQPDEDK